MKSKVYFTDMRTHGGNLLNKLDKLMKEAGIETIDFKEKFVAIKIHFGEPGNLAFLRPNFAKTVADRVKALGGKPFLTDSNTLYVGRRNNAIVHMEAAYENGYTPFSTGVHNIIADGLKGTDDVEVPVPGGELLKVARIGRAIMDADVFISLTHFKGHEATGFGGAIKNIGMGSGSRAGKMAMHNEGKPVVNQDKCVGCKQCAKACNENAFTYGSNKKATITDKCIGCGHCIGACNFNAIYNPSWTSNTKLNQKMVEYAAAVVHGRPAFHINIVNQVSPNCDCNPGNDAALVPDIGMFAGFDPVALDKACIDAVNAAPALKLNVLDERERKHKDACGHDDHFSDVHPTTDWRSQIEHGEKIGLGSSDYELITI